MRWLGIWLMITGAVLIAFLYFGGATKYREQRELVESFQQMNSESVMEAKEVVRDSEMASAEERPKSGTVGVLTIQKLDLELPVVEGAGAEELARALGAIPGLDEPGQMGGSYAIAGHRSTVFGQDFNRLDELKSGDLVELQTTDQLMTFKVYHKQIVKPEQVEVLQPEKGKAKLTLVTCHPANSSKYRLIVEAERIKR